MLAHERQDVVPVGAWQLVVTGLAAFEGYQAGGALATKLRHQSLDLPVAQSQRLCRGRLGHSALSDPL